MWTGFKRALSRVVGGSQPNRIEWCVFEVQNDEVKKNTLVTTVFLEPEIVEGRRLSFRMSPLLKNAASATAGHNLLGHLRNQIDVAGGERIVIQSIVQTQVSNELDGELRFIVSTLFDHDDDTQHIRGKIDAAISLDNAAVDVQQQRQVPLRLQTMAEKTRSSNNNNNNADTSGGNGQVLDTESMQDEDESEDTRRRLDLLMDNAADDVPFQGDSAEEIIRKAESITIRGKQVHRNRVEITNTMSLGPIAPATTSCTHKVLYKASATEDIIRWFAGQDRIVAENPLQVHSEINTDKETRADKPVLEYLIYPQDHALILFIKMFSDHLNRRDNELVLMQGDREEQHGKLWYRVSRDLISRAREMILYVVYAQIYYTTLRDCSLTRTIESDEQEYALVRRLAKQWKLDVDARTGRVSDWAPGAYRPIVAITLQVTYFTVTGVESSAASLHKKMTLLSPL